MTVTSPYRELHKKPRALAQALIDGLGPDQQCVPMAFEQGWIHSDRDGREVHTFTNGRIRVYDAAGKLEREYEG